MRKDRDTASHCIQKDYSNSAGIIGMHCHIWLYFLILEKLLRVCSLTGVVKVSEHNSNHTDILDMAVNVNLVNISLSKARVNKKGKFPLPIEGGHD